MDQIPPRYETLRLLGEGGMGRVWLAKDAATGDEVAVKVFAPIAGDVEAARFAFRHEFWALSAFRHPGLVAPRDFEEPAEGPPCFSMDYVPGLDLSDVLAAAPQAEAAVLSWLPDLLGALGHLHGRGSVHGDLKPANVRVDGGRATLMDLGLLRPAGRTGQPISGSLPYVAPEVVRGGAVDARADLYALGALLHEALTGRPPFVEADTTALLRAHLFSAPLPPSRLVAGVSPALDAMVLRLLAKEPAARPADVGEVLAGLGLAGADALAVSLFAPPLIGRDEALEAGLAALADDRPTALRFTGGPGSGRSRLLHELVAATQLDGRPAFVARGLGVEAPAFAAVLPWLRALVARQPLVAAPLAPALAAVLPELGLAPGGEPGAARARLFAAVAELAAAEPEAVWALDDADLLDADSAALADHLRRATGPGRRVWLETSRTDEAVRGVRDLALAPMDEAGFAQLATAILGSPAPAGFATRLVQQAAGSPGFAEALIARWVRAGALRKRDGRWEVLADEAAFELPPALHAHAEAELAELLPAARRLAAAAAVLAPAGDVPTLLAVAGLSTNEGLAGLEALEAAGWLVRESSSWRLAHPGRARAYREVLPADEAAGLHAAAAAALSAGLPDPAAPDAPMATVLAVTEHLLASLTPGAAISWIEAAARRAAALGAAARVEALAERAIAHPAIPDSARPALQATLATAHRLRGDVDAALVASDAAQAGYQLAGLAAPAHDLIGHGLLLQMKARYAEAEAAYAAGIAAADAAGDEAEGVRGRLFAGRVAHFAGRPSDALPRLADATARARAAGLSAPLAAALSLHGYLIATTRPHEAPAGLAALDEAIALAQSIGEESEAMDAMNLRGDVLMALGRLTEAVATFTEGLAIADRLGLGNEALFFRLNLAAAALERGHASTALAEARAASTSAREQGRRFPESFGLALEGAALVAGGAPGAGGKAIAAGLAVAREIGNRYVELPILVLQADASLTLGDFPAARAALAAAEALAASAGSDEQRPQLARVSCALAALDPTAAFDALDLAVQAAEATGHPVARLHARRWQVAAAIDAEDLGAATDWLAEARAGAATSGLDGLGAELLLEAARLANAQGDLAGARDAALAAEDAARGLGLRALAIDALATAAEADPAGSGASDAAAAFESLAADMAADARADYLAHPRRGALFRSIAPGTGLPLARLRRLAELIADVAAERTMGAVVQAALAGFAELAEADRAFLLLYDGLKLTDRAFWGMAADDADAFSSALAYKTLWSDEPLWVEDVGSDAELGGRASVQALAMRSALGVPLHNGERTIGVVLADSRRPNPRFGPAEREAVRALAAHTALAIDAARARAAASEAGGDAETLWALALAVAGAPDLQVAGRLVAAAAVERLGAERGLVLRGANLLTEVGVGRGGRELRVDDRRPSGTVAGWVLEHGEPVQLLDAQADEDFQGRGSIMALGLRAIAAVPINAGGTRLGVLYVDARYATDADPTALRTVGRMADLLGARLQTL